MYYDDSHDEPYRAIVHWYYKIHELPLKVHNKIPSCLSDEFELFWPVIYNKHLQGCIDDIDATTIKRKCLVIVLPSKTMNRKDTRTYFIRFGFTVDYKLISDLELLDNLSRIANNIKQLNTPVRTQNHTKKTPKKGQGIA